jgi:hypothetical protein
MTTNHRRSEPVTFAGGVLDRYRHVCAFLSGTEEADGVLDPFIRDGLESGDRMVYVVNPAESAAPVVRLRHLGYDAAELLEQHRCEVRTWTETYLTDGRFSQQAMLVVLEQMLESESPPIRMICDMGWAAGRNDIAKYVIEYEARANFVHPDRQHIAICSYNAAAFDGAFIIDILRTHPMVLIGGMLQENPFYVDPATFLEERGRRATG